MIYSPAYYIQTNVFCVLLFILLLIIQKKHNKTNTTESLLFKRLIYLTIVYCSTDIVAWFSDGAKFSGAKELLIISSIIYIILPAFFCFIWLEYVYYILYTINLSDTTKGKLLLSPLVILTALVLTTPFTNFAFFIDDNNLYERRIGAYFLPVICLVYLLYSTIKVLIFIKNTDNKLKKTDVIPLLYFGIPVLVVAVLQLSWYGLSVTQIGFSFSIILLFLNMQYDKISIDELTGLNNRRELRQYLYGVFNNEKTDNIFLCMIDVDFFKSINDNYGHIEGDEALVNVSNLLKKVCSMYKQRLFLARYGGDEFIIAGVNVNDELIEDIKVKITEMCKEYNINSDKPYKITLSCGSAMGNKCDLESHEELLKIADERMYDIKKKRVR